MGHMVSWPVITKHFALTVLEPQMLVFLILSPLLAFSNLCTKTFLLFFFLFPFFLFTDFFNHQVPSVSIPSLEFRPHSLGFFYPQTNIFYLKYLLLYILTSISTGNTSVLVPYFPISLLWLLSLSPFSSSVLVMLVSVTFIKNKDLLP